MSKVPSSRIQQCLLPIENQMVVPLQNTLSTVPMAFDVMNRDQFAALQEAGVGVTVILENTSISTLRVSRFNIPGEGFLSVMPTQTQTLFSGNLSDLIAKTTGGYSFTIIGELNGAKLVLRFTDLQNLNSHVEFVIRTNPSSNPL